MRTSICQERSADASIICDAAFKACHDSHNTLMSLSLNIHLHFHTKGSIVAMRWTFLVLFECVCTNAFWFRYLLNCFQVQTRTFWRYPDKIAPAVRGCQVAIQPLEVRHLWTLLKLPSKKAKIITFKNPPKYLNPWNRFWQSTYFKQPRGLSTRFHGVDLPIFSRAVYVIAEEVPLNSGLDIFEPLLQTTA